MCVCVYVYDCTFINLLDAYLLNTYFIPETTK